MLTKEKMIELFPALCACAAAHMFDEFNNSIDFLSEFGVSDEDLEAMGLSEDMEYED